MDCSSCSGEGGWDRSGMPGMFSRPERREERLSEGEESDPPRGMMDVAAAHEEYDDVDDVVLLPMMDLLR
jgi:hypothetical protein